MHMLDSLSSLLTERLLPTLGPLGLETHTGAVFCSFWWQRDPPLVLYEQKVCYHIPGPREIPYSEKPLFFLEEKEQEVCDPSGSSLFVDIRNHNGIV